MWSHTIASTFMVILKEAFVSSMYKTLLFSNLAFSIYQQAFLLMVYKRDPFRLVIPLMAPIVVSPGLLFVIGRRGSPLRPPLDWVFTPLTESGLSC